MKLNNKGFTFVEILAVIVMIGILTAIAIVGVSKYQEKAKNKDYEALAKSSYNAMEEYMMSHPYEDDATLEKLVNENLLSNRQDPGSKDTECEGTVIVEKGTGSGGNLDDGTYKVYLCCASYKKMYTYPGGKVSDLDDPSKCKAAPSPGGSGEPTIICSPGLYLKKSYTVCTQCPSGSYCPGGSFKKSDTKDQGINPCPNCYKNSNAGSSLITQCYSKVSANNHVKTKNECPVACPTGQNRDAHEVRYGQTSTCTNEKITVTFNCSPGKTSSGSTTVSKNYESNATGQKFNVKCTRTGYEQPADKAWKNNKTNDIYKLNSGVSVSFIHNNKPSVTVNALWEKIKVKCKAGQYLPKASTKCNICTSGYYCPGGTYSYNPDIPQGINKCSTNAVGYPSSAQGSDAINDCYMNVPENKYIKVAKDKTPTACPSGTLKKGPYIVYYGRVSSCSNKSIEVTFNCNGGKGDGKQTFKSDVAGQKFTTKCTPAQCKVQDGWKRDKNGTAKNYETNSGVSENFVLTYSPKITLYAHWKTQSIKCNAGYYLKKGATTCTKCEAGYYCPGNTYSCGNEQGRTKCPNCYPNSPAGSSKQSDCYANVTKNNYVKTANTCPVACPSGTYKDAHVVNHGKVSSCSNKSISVTFDCNGGSRSAGSSPVTYNTNNLGKFTTKCSRSGYEQEGWKKVKTATSRDYNTDSNVTENWILTNSPKITLYAHWKKACVTCAAGQYLPANSTSCTQCKAGNYCPGGTYCSPQGMNACPNGYKNSPAGSSKENQCYMNVGANYYVAKAKATSSTACGTGQYKAAHKVNYGGTSSCSWTSYKITYNLNGGNATVNPTSYTANTATFTLKNPTRSGYKFVGWTGTGLSGKTMTVTIPKGSTGNRSYTANWYQYCSKTWTPSKGEDFPNCSKSKYNIKMFKWSNPKDHATATIEFDLAVYACNCTMDSEDHSYACGGSATNYTKCHHTYYNSFIIYTSKANKKKVLNGTNSANEYVKELCNKNATSSGYSYHSYRWYKGAAKDGYNQMKKTSANKGSFYTIGGKTIVDGTKGADAACKAACDIKY